MFITFEGIDGCGKTTQIKLLKKEFNNRKLKFISVREPGSTQLAEQIRKILLNPNNTNISSKTEALLFASARAQMVKEIIIPALDQDKNVICDRFIDSTLAYQVFGKGVEKNLIDGIHKHILRGVKPDITFLLKIKISKALKRLNKRKKKNRYDKFSKKFYEKAQNAFINIARANKKKYVIIDNSEDSKTTENLILKSFLRLMNK